MSLHCHLHEDHMHNLKHIQRQIKLLDLRLQTLRDRLCAARMHRLALPCCHSHHCSPHHHHHSHHCSPHHHHHHHHLFSSRCLARSSLAARLERLRRLGLMLNSCCSHSHSCSSLPCFDPCDVSVVVKDGKMTVSAERKEEHNSCLGRTSTHRKFIKEISLPPACPEEYCMESNSLTKIEPAANCCSCICDY